MKTTKFIFSYIIGISLSLFLLSGCVNSDNKNAPVKQKKED